MFFCIKTNNFLFFGNTKTEKLFDNNKCDRNGYSSPCNGSEHTKEL